MSLLPEVRDELVAVAARRAATRPPRRRRGGAVAVAIGVACTVAVAVVAVVALSHRAPAPTGSDRSGGPVAGLEAKLAILRRPQTAADRTFSRYSRVRGMAIANLARLAATTDTSGGATRVYLLIRQVARRLSFAIVVAVDRHGQIEGGTGPVTATSMKPNAVGSSGVVVPGVGIERDRGLSVGIVPDGVTRVKWTFTGADYGVLDPHPITVYPFVHGNVAVAPIRPGQGPLASAVWYGSGGKVIASAGLSTSATNQLGRIAAVNASRKRRVDPVLVAHYRLFRMVPPVDLTADPLVATVGNAPDLNYWQTRYIGSVTGLDGRGLWITPGAHDVCMSDWNAGGCGAPKPAGFIGGSTSNGSETTFEGLVPDGNPTVTLVLSDGRRETFPVTDNVYEATFKGRLIAVVNRDINGRVVSTPLR